jgi:hypothetical protein
VILKKWSVMVNRIFNMYFLLICVLASGQVLLGGENSQLKVFVENHCPKQGKISLNNDTWYVDRDIKRFLTCDQDNKVGLNYCITLWRPCYWGLGIQQKAHWLKFTITDSNKPAMEEFFKKTKQNKALKDQYGFIDALKKDIPAAQVTAKHTQDTKTRPTALGWIAIGLGAIGLSYAGYTYLAHGK